MADIQMDDKPLTFGKWKGSTPNQVADTDSGYIVWMYENVQPSKCSRDLYLACEMDMREAQAEQDLEQMFEDGYDWRP